MYTGTGESLFFYYLFVIFSFYDARLRVRLNLDLFCTFRDLFRLPCLVLCFFPPPLRRGDRDDDDTFRALALLPGELEEPRERGERGDLEALRELGEGGELEWLCGANCENCDTNGCIVVFVGVVAVGVFPVGVVAVGVVPVGVGSGVFRFPGNVAPESAEAI